ncbi:GapA-binding peptide SR1P [Oceanobacillus polygoni]|nr:GapA-binding peptide SR1P [Oceanobacillus polygoni]
MRQIICQKCEKIIEYTECEKVDTLYGKCPDCHPDKKS